MSLFESRRLLVLVALSGCAALAGSLAAPASAWAKPRPTSTVVSGTDVSYPQCGSALPAGMAFAVVGLNDGLANNYNPCLKSQYAYAGGTSGATHQTKAQVYVNTADPSATVGDWPYGSAMAAGQPLGAYGSSATSDPYGSCGAYQASPACAFVYGYDLVAGMTASIPGDTAAFTAATGQPAASTVWWLDVETTNSWQSGAGGLEMNLADLQGMVAALGAAGVSPVGIYSTSYQWATITGTPGPSAYGVTNTLYGSPEWVAGATSSGGARSNCAQTSFTGGTVTVSQWVSRLDYDLSCLG